MVQFLFNSSSRHQTKLKLVSIQGYVLLGYLLPILLFFALFFPKSIPLINHFQKNFNPGLYF